MQFFREVALFDQLSSEGTRRVQTRVNSALSHQCRQSLPVSWPGYLPAPLPGSVLRLRSVLLSLPLWFSNQGNAATVLSGGNFAAEEIARDNDVNQRGQTSTISTTQCQIDRGFGLLTRHLRRLSRGLVRSPRFGAARSDEDGALLDDRCQRSITRYAAAEPSKGQVPPSIREAALRTKGRPQATKVE